LVKERGRRLLHPQRKRKGFLFVPRKRRTPSYLRRMLRAGKKALEERFYLGRR